MPDELLSVVHCCMWGAAARRCSMLPPPQQIQHKREQPLLKEAAEAESQPSHLVLVTLCHGAVLHHCKAWRQREQWADSLKGMKEFWMETLPASNHSGTLRMPIFVSSCRKRPSLRADVLRGKRMGPASKVHKALHVGCWSRTASPRGAGCQPQLSWQSGRAPALPAGTCSDEPWAPQSCF